MSLQLEWSNDQDRITIPDSYMERLKQLLDIAAEAEGITKGDVALTFVDDAGIHQLNLEYRGIDRPTDVLSFAMQEETDEELDILYEVESEDEAFPFEGMLGDIIISAERAKAQSEEYGHSLEREIGFLFVHGFLHLIGYDHGDEASEAVMTEKQEAVLSKAGLSR
ncbi:rRNA maturation RNase YbeY [Paenibacillus mendelii]|uniref:Endoribonuclease YbeY n=1 Tax=Paenibacillus mendelii TaxID=206163 RepID=A0ABV6JHR2_9BACL|nr:rRNA maturation RNase YbeY [Paenibacillus mendelii]MCQ6558323.1 rRNA maturation RNase YbeY [Paenibacillus mendelii]